MKMHFFFSFMIAFLYCTLVKATDYEFSTDTFQLGRWNSKSISYQQGLGKIEALDKWWGSLTFDQKVESTKAYTLNRNRLFLVTQEKRLRSEIERPIDPLELARDQIQPSWIAAGRNVLRQDKKKMYSDLRTLNETALAETEELSGELIRSLADISKIGLKDSGGLNFAPSFSKSLSKSGGSSIGLGAQRMTPPTFSALDIKCKKGDKACLQKLKTSLSQRFQSLFDTPPGRELEDILSRSRLSRPVCNEFGGSHGPLVESPEYKTFQKKRDDFLKKIDSQNWKSNKSENDLSRWYSEPVTQWVSGKSTNRCVGHAISSDIAATAKKVRF
jgi:hypothetical protein